AAEVESKAARLVAEEQSGRAESEADTANEVAKFLISVFSTADPIGSVGLGLRRASESTSSLTAVELLDRGSLRIRTELKEKPIVRAAMLDLIGSVYRSL